MLISLSKKEIEINKKTLCYYHSSGKYFCFGYTENGWIEEQLESIFGKQRLLLLKQVHKINIINQNHFYDGVEADGIFLNQPGVVGIIKTADCLPIFFYGENFAGLVHAGWRGISQGIVEVMLSKIGSGKLNKVKFVLGAAIEQNCYEVQLDVVKIFWERFPEKKNEIVKEKNGKYFLGLKAAVKNILFSYGVDHLQLTEIERCTFCDWKLPSYRRDREKAGRIYNFIYLK